MQSENKRKQHKIGYGFGILLGIVLIVVFQLPGNATYHSPGPLIQGHEKLKCQWCHKDTKGSLRQKLQANMQYLINNRRNPIPLGYRQVTNDDCLACHERANDKHPVFRFFEPRYAKARKQLQPHLCTSCHMEHSGKRVAKNTDFCVTCHELLKLKKDPISIPHKTLVDSKRWDTCLGCHDFHGNHRMKIPRNVGKRIDKAAIDLYFNDGPDVYGLAKVVTAKETLSDDSK